MSDHADGSGGASGREQFNLATVSEVVAAAVPDREAIVFGDRRFTFGQLAERTRRLASYLHGRGLGCRTSTWRAWSVRGRPGPRRST